MVAPPSFNNRSLQVLGKFKKTCDTCNTVMILDEGQTRKFCRMCLNARTSVGVQRVWDIKHWTTKHIRDSIPLLQEYYYE